MLARADFVAIFTRIGRSCEIGAAHVQRSIIQKFWAGRRRRGLFTLSSNESPDPPNESANPPNESANVTANGNANAQIHPGTPALIVYDPW